MNDLEAMIARHSRRSYLGTPIDSESLKILRESIDHYNTITSMSIQLIENGKEAFNGILKSYGMFHGVNSFIALVGSKKDPDLKEKAGYFGERLALQATKLNLGTCWVGGSFDKKRCPCTIRENEELICVITIGNVEEEKSLKEKAIYKMTHHRVKPLEYFYTCDVPIPDWFLSGIKAVSIAPSAANRQPVHFTLKNGIVTASAKKSVGYELVDLGIAKLHFELATGKHFEYGNPAIAL